MKLVRKSLEGDIGCRGSITLIPEMIEDMWHVYNLVSSGDSVRASTIRKVKTESASGATSSNRLRTTLTIRVEDIDFDNLTSKMRLKGRNIEENQYVRMGAYHTLDIETNTKFTLTKSEWDSVALNRIELATDPTKYADIAAVVMQEGIANVCLITSCMTIVRTKIDVHIPRKRQFNAQQHEKTLIRFYETVLQAILRHVNFDVVKCLLIASPGFTKDKFFEYVLQQAQKCDIKLIFENRAKFLLVHCSSGFKHSLREVLMDPLVQSRLSDTKAFEEVRCLESFYRMLHSEPSRAFYGLSHVSKAVEAQAVETLLISDRLFRANDVVKRKMYVELVDGVREFGGDVKIFSSMHVSGEQLDQLTGICAVLRFPMPELEDDDSCDDSDSSAEADCV